MRKELIGILLFFLVIFILSSLFSFDPKDAFFHHPGANGSIHNFFGYVGATAAGQLIGLFGLGAYWIPILLLISSIHFFNARPGATIAVTITGGLILAVTTGSLVSFRDHYVLIWGSGFPSGGWIGLYFHRFLIAYTNISGSLVILFLLWIVGLILTTGFSLVGFAEHFWMAIRFVFVRKRAETKTISPLKDTPKIDPVKKRTKPSKAQAVDLPSAPISLPQPIVTPPPPVSLPPAVTPPSVVTPPPAVAKQPVVSQQPVIAKEPAATPQPNVDKVRETLPKQIQTEGNSVGFSLPSVSFLDDPDVQDSQYDTEYLQSQARLLEKTLEDFNVRGAVTAISPGPVITTFEYEPAPGVKINKIVNLADDLSLALKAMSIRIVAPIPGKAVIGIEIPNNDRQIVRFKEIVVSPAFEKSRSCLTLCMGKDIVGNPVVAELDRMPHLLIAGATGTGKSVGLNAMICSLLYKSTPDQVKLIMIDPKRIELSLYDGIPHLITPVVTDVKKATNALFWAVREMERRYQLLSEHKARNITQFNQKMEKAKAGPDGIKPDKLPLIVIIIDELADLMMVASRDVEVALTRLAQMARASGIHLILATQRPSVDVLTGIIKANFPTRLSFQVSSRTDSRTIIDSNGAESLLGNGDMLLLPPGTAKLQRIHGAYISEEELSRIIESLKEQMPPEYDTMITEAITEEENGTSEEDHDDRYDDAVALVTKTRQASISMVQRHLRIGYNRAARIIETMEKEGIIGPSDGVKPREVLVTGYDDMP
jgi:S-DNA-T family DNA segregation ATPase FtsK/SpoIIIE